MRAFPIRLPSGSTYWTVLDDDLEVVPAADDFLQHLRLGRDRAESTTRSYAGALALYLTWCDRTGRNWRTAERLGGFITWLQHVPGGAADYEVFPGPGSRTVRGPGRVNFVLTVVREFFKHTVAAGVVPATVLAGLYEIADDRHLPAEVRGEDSGLRYYAKVRHRLSEPDTPVDNATDEEIMALLRACHNARDRFIVLALARTGLRRGELAGVRLVDLHFLPDAAQLGCDVPDAHLHVVRRENPNRAWAKSRRTRAVPVDHLLVQAYDLYSLERAGCAAAWDCDFVLVNLFRPPLGAPMRPGALNELFAALSRRAKLDRLIHPHMLRHSFGTSVTAAGGSLDEAQALLGHAQVSSTRDLHASFTCKAPGRRRTCRLALGVRSSTVTAAVPVLAGQPDDHDLLTERLHTRLDREFLAAAGWDAELQVLAPAPEHPLLGYWRCLRAGCQVTTVRRSRLCHTCEEDWKGGGLEFAAFTATAAARQHRRQQTRQQRITGEFDCEVVGCQRLAASAAARLCSTHANQRRNTGLASVEAFLARPGVRPLPSLGACGVASCIRQAGVRVGLCDAHYSRWRKHQRQDPGGGLVAWCRHQPPLSTLPTVIVLRGLPPLVQAEVLYGLQERCRRGHKTRLAKLRLLSRALHQTGVASILALDATPRRRPVRPDHHDVLAGFQASVACVASTPEAEQRKDVWNMGVFGRTGVLDFTVVSQDWLRAAIKHWVAEELPKRRGDSVTGALRDFLLAVRELSTSLRLRRADQGTFPGRLGRGDLVAFTNRLAHLEATGKLTLNLRIRHCRCVTRLLRDFRAMGLIRPGGPLAGLPDDVALTRDDIPLEPDGDAVGRALPEEILRQLIIALPQLQARYGREA